MKNNNNIIPMVTYNASRDKSKIYEENRRKSGVYHLINIINSKSYVGSSVDLSRRFRIYYSLNSIERKLNKGLSAIYSALLKYGYSNFSLNILEHCEPNVLITREQYYIDLLKPEYNILKIAGDKLGLNTQKRLKPKWVLTIVV